MKVAVTVQLGERSAAVDPRFGRAPWFVVVDTDTNEVAVHDNRAAAAAQDGAGVASAAAVAALGVQAVITGNVGPKAFEALRAAGLDVYLVYTGTVVDVVQRLLAGKLRRAEQPTRRGHGWATPG